MNLKHRLKEKGAGIEIEQFYVNVDSDVPVYLQLAGQLKDGIVQRQYDPEKPLPSVYKFYRALGVSRSTVFRAYKHLNRNGDVKWIKGQGFFVQQKMQIADEFIRKQPRR